MTPRAVVFGHHDVGDRCLRALISQGWDVPLVVTHAPDPSEPRWYADVAETADEHDIPVLRPMPSELGQLERTLRELRPDFIFSFYYRAMLGAEILQHARRGALNMHGSLLPKYRGRAPVNWAILNGERETGVTLHYMSGRADAGDIVDQLAVPILADDTASQVMRKVAVTAEIVLCRALPLLATGEAPRIPQQVSDSDYCGRRSPEDGRIDWSWPAARIHDLVRAVAPPYPGAFAEVNAERWWIHRTQLVPGRIEQNLQPRLFAENGRCYIACSDGRVLRLMAGAVEGKPLDLASLAKHLEQQPRLLRV